MAHFTICVCSMHLKVHELSVCVPFKAEMLFFVSFLIVCFLVSRIGKKASAKNTNVNVTFSLLAFEEACFGHVG